MYTSKKFKPLNMKVCLTLTVLRKLNTQRRHGNSRIILQLLGTYIAHFRYGLS